MSPQKRKKLEAAIDNLFSAPKMKANQNQVQAEEGNGNAQPAETTQGIIEIEEAVTPPEKNNLSDLAGVIGTPEVLSSAEVDPLHVSAPPTPIEKAPAPVAALGELAEKQTAILSSPPPPMPDQNPADEFAGYGDSVQLVIFTLNGQYYGIGIEAVDSIIKMKTITELPHAPYFIVGLINLRGKVLPVISLRRRFGFTEEESTKNSRIIVINVDQKEAGIIVDGVSEVETIFKKDIEPSPVMTGSNASRPIDGIAKLDDRLVILLNLSKVILPGS